MLTLFSDQLNSTLHQSSNAFRQIADTFFNTKSILTLVIALLLAITLGRLLAAILRRLANAIGRRVDRTEDLTIVTKLRRTETLIVLSIAAIRAILVIIALYFWWIINHPTEQPTALIGASAILALVLSGALSPILRDLAYGTVMMAEHWYGVGDHISVDPLVDAQGVVERVTLRSTRIRGVNGEIIWINNQSIAAVRVAPKGVRTIALELFVSDIDKGTDLIEETNVRLPIGALVVVSPLTIMTEAKVGDKLWHITAVAEVAPGREWLLDKFAITMLQEIDEKYHVLVHNPITRYADSEAERRFARTIHNSRKSRIRRQSVVKKVTTQRTKRLNRANKD